jgi:predicted ArsR family transcriptional regulator
MKGESTAGMAGRRPATLEEMRAVAHPLRLQILRLCLDQAMTNQQLAERLAKDPATVLHHVRTLVTTGFLAVEPVRHGDSGALEKPYRATGKSWTLDVGDRGDEYEAVALAALDAFRAELLEAGPHSTRSWARLGLTLNEQSLKELTERLSNVLQDFVDRGRDENGEPYGVYWVVHRRV